MSAMQHHSHYRAMLAIAVSALLPVSGNSHAAAALSAYRDEAELGAALARWRAAAQSRQQARLRSEVGIAQSLNAPAPAPAAAASPLKAGADQPAEASDSITNVQTAGVDEGGIVKRAGDHLVILRRGRLFTVRVGGDQLQPVSQLDAFAPGSDSRGA